MYVCDLWYNYRKHTHVYITIENTHMYGICDIITENTHTHTIQAGKYAPVFPVAPCDIGIYQDFQWLYILPVSNIFR